MIGAADSLASLLATIHGLYPNARVTSGYRGPNNPLTLRNPASLHAQGSPEDPRAVDVAPIPGVSFDQYVNSVKQAGVPIRQAFDEASHPFPWTTGPNWHLATGQPQPMASYIAPKKARNLAQIAQRPSSLFPVVGGVDPLAANPEPYYSPQPAAPPMSLAALGASQYPVANGADPLAAQKHKSPLNAGNIMGVLGDALMAYGGLRPEFAPALAQQQQDERSQAFDREKLNAMLDIQREKALQPKPLTQTQQFVNEIMDPNTPPARKALLRAILTRPLIGTVTNSDGSQYQTQTYPGQDSGSDDDWEYSN